MKNFVCFAVIVIIGICLTVVYSAGHQQGYEKAYREIRQKWREAQVQV